MQPRSPYSGATTTSQVSAHMIVIHTGSSLSHPLLRPFTSLALDPSVQINPRSY